MPIIPSLHSVRYQTPRGPVTALVAGESELADALAAALPAGEVVPAEPAATRRLVAWRGGVATAGEAWLREAEPVVVVDPSEEDQRAAQRTMGGRSNARLITFESLDTAAAAEHTLLLMLALSRRLLLAYTELVSGTRRPGVGSRLTGEEPGARNWPGISEPVTLAGHTLGVLGLGRIGQAVAARARTLGMRVLYHDSAPRDAAAARLGVEPRPFAELLRESDILSLHLTLNPGTLRLIDAPELAQMRPEALLINTAHGRLLDEGALIKALQVGAIAGAGLDVFAYEALPATSPLLGLANVVLTPHLAGVDPESNRRDAATPAPWSASKVVRNTGSGRAPERHVA